MFDQALGFFDDHFGDCHVSRCRLVEGRCHHLASHRALHLGDFLGALVDQQDDQDDIGMIGGDRMRDVLHQHGFAGLGRRHDQTALPFADRRDHVDDAGGVVFFGLGIALEHHRLIGMQGRQILEQDLVLARLGRLAIDLVDLDQSEVALAVFGRAHLAFDRVAGVQVEASDLRGRDIDVVGAREIGGFGRAQEAEAVWQHFETAVAENLFTGFSASFEDREHQFLLAQAVGVFDVEAGGHLDQRRNMKGFEFGKVHGEGAGSERLRGPDRDTGNTGVSRRIETGGPVGVTGETKLRGKTRRKNQGNH